MCDYSLENRVSRPAVVGEKLITTNFGSGTGGFAAVDDTPASHGGRTSDMVAVCLLPGTELAFDGPVRTKAWYQYIEAYHWASDAVFHPEQEIEHKVARFTKINVEAKSRHHDGLEFPDRIGVAPVLLTNLVPGQVATVLQMPVDEEAARKLDEATRAKAPEYVD
jgi:hypothetical protein